MKKAVLLLLCVSVAGCATGTGTLPAGHTSGAPSLRRHSGPTDATIYLFQGQPDAKTPYAGLANLNGTFYGTTPDGGTDNAGTIFSVTAGGTEHILHSFSGAADGGSPYASLIVVKGKLYGTTTTGGANGIGTVFSISASGTEKVLYSFGNNPNDGANPYGDLLDRAGALYGTTRSCANDQACFGTVFEIALAGKPADPETVLYRFAGGTSDGGGPLAGLVYLKGNFYGTTASYGSGGEGIVFRMTPSGQESVLHAFSGAPDGAGPLSDLLSYDGKLYGTTPGGGTANQGTVFRVTQAGRETVIHSFVDANGDFFAPQAGLINVGGTFYGTAAEAATGYGGVFSITPAGQESSVYVFPDTPAGSPTAPYGGVIDVNGMLYGTSISSTGQLGYGTVYAVPL